MNAIWIFFNSGRILRQINCTTLCLIPKCEKPENITQFRPVACCKVIYNIIFKLLCYKLKQVLPSIVDRVQSAFIEKRLIMHNILICQYMFKQYKNKIHLARCTMKVDLRKAYDSVHWSFIEDFLGKLQFPPHLIKWL